MVETSFFLKLMSGPAWENMTSSGGQIFIAALRKRMMNGLNAHL